MSTAPGRPVPLYRATFRWIFIIDACGVSMILGAYLVDRLTERGKLAIRGAASAVGWAAIAWWRPDATWAKFVSEGLFGSLGPKVSEFSFPLVPWFSIYLAGSLVGERLGRMYMRDGLWGTPRALQFGGLAADTTPVSGNTPQFGNNTIGTSARPQS